MGQYKGTLSSIEINTIKSGQNEGQEYRKIGVGKARFNVFDAKFFKSLNEMKGQEVVVEYKERDNPQKPEKPYWDFEDIKLSISKAEINPKRNTDRSIERQVCLKEAMHYCEIKAQWGHTTILGIDEVIDIADKLANWLNYEVVEATTEETPLEELPPQESWIDLAWLKESLGILQSKKIVGWSNTNVIAYLKTKYHVVGNSVTESVLQLNKEDAEEFVREILDTLEKA